METRELSRDEVAQVAEQMYEEAEQLRAFAEVTTTDSLRKAFQAHADQLHAFADRLTAAIM